MIDVPIQPYDATHAVIHVSVIYDSMHEGIVLLMQLSSPADSPEELAKVDNICGSSLFLPDVEEPDQRLIEACERSARLEIDAKFGEAWTAVVHFAGCHRLVLL